MPWQFSMWLIWLDVNEFSNPPHQPFQTNKQKGQLVRSHRTYCAQKPLKQRRCKYKELAKLSVDLTTLFSLLFFFPFLLLSLKASSSCRDCILFAPLRALTLLISTLQLSAGPCPQTWFHYYCSFFSNRHHASYPALGLYPWLMHRPVSAKDIHVLHHLPG